MITDVNVVRHSRSESPFRVTIESKTFDFTNYSFLGMSENCPTVAEWVLTEDLPFWKDLHSKINKGILNASFY